MYSRAYYTQSDFDLLVCRIGKAPELVNVHCLNCKVYGVRYQWPAYFDPDYGYKPVCVRCGSIKVENWPDPDSYYDDPPINLLAEVRFCPPEPEPLRIFSHFQSVCEQIQDGIEEEEGGLDVAD